MRGLLFWFVSSLIIREVKDEMHSSVWISLEFMWRIQASKMQKKLVMGRVGEPLNMRKEANEQKSLKFHF